MREIQPPKATAEGGKPMEIQSVEFFEGKTERAGDAEEEEVRRSREWEGFITVPASLSSRGRESAIQVPMNAHMTI